MSYVNADGLEVLTAGEQGTAAKRGTSLSSQKKALVMNITGTEVPSSVATPQDHDAFIPAGSYITGASLIVTTAFTSGGSATLTIGTYEQDASVVDADGIDATIAVADLVANKAVACNGAAVGGTATVGAADVYIEAIYGTAAFTAGEAKLVIEYIEP
tara:strand:- start:9247 stop:9720 length:474 start_codon:yes stop_codon:yes gene_type:complete